MRGFCVCARTPLYPPGVRARTALGLATDLGGYAIMLGGTSGAHLTSFSLVFSTASAIFLGRGCPRKESGSTTSL